MGHRLPLLGALCAPLAITLVTIATVALGSGARLGAADDAGGDYERHLAAFGAWGHPVPLDAQAADGLSPGQGLMIRWVRPGGPAAQMGLEPGDVILKLNDAPIASRLDLRTQVLANAPGAKAEALVIKRGGDIAVLDGTFGERRTNRPLRPLTDQWEQQVKQQQLDELLARQADLDDLARQVDEAERAVGDADADGSAVGPDGLPLPWSVSHRWTSPEPVAASAPVASAVAPATAGGDGDAWRFDASVPARDRQ